MIELKLWPIVYQETYPAFLEVYIMPPIAMYFKYIKTLRRYNITTMSIIDINTKKVIEQFEYFLPKKDSICFVTNNKTGEKIKYDNIFLAWEPYQALLESQLVKK